MKSENVLLSISFDLALDIPDFYKELKKTDETEYWFQIIEKNIKVDECLFKKIDELIQLLVSIINSQLKEIIN